MHDRPHGIKIGGALWKESRAWEFGRLNDTTREALADAAVCDRQIYVDGAERMRTELSIDLSRRKPQVQLAADATTARATTADGWPEQIMARWCDQRVSR